MFKLYCEYHYFMCMDKFDLKYVMTGRYFLSGTFICFLQNISITGDFFLKFLDSMHWILYLNNVVGSC